MSNIKRSWNGLLLVALLGSTNMAAAGAFIASGPLDDGSGGFTATVNYTSIAAPTDVMSNDFYDFSTFAGTIDSIEYILYSNDGSVLFSATEYGESLNAIRVRNYKKGSASVSDTIQYLANTDSGSVLSFVVMRFLDTSNAMVDDANIFPGTVDLASITSNEVFFGFSDASGDSLFQRGEVTEISDADPFAECLESARNHGQYVSCVSHLTNSWKKAGDITGREKGEIQSAAAKNK